MNSYRAKILDMIPEYYKFTFQKQPFVPGVTPIPCSGRVFDEEELVNLTDASLDFWLTSGRYAARFEDELSRFLSVRRTILCNSGSSANLLAVSALTSPKLGDRKINKGDEIIAVASSFPTTINPIFQNNIVPVFVDVELGTYNVDPKNLEEAVSPRSRAIMLAHTLGNPFDVNSVLVFARKHNLWVIEDNCDSLGSKYNGGYTGSFGDLATVSFYPAHHITMGEGGCVLTQDPKLAVIVESFRDWGRDCWCEPGKSNTCGKRFKWQLGNLPYGYDHKYTYTHIGYNLKLTDMQAAIGVAQLKKLPHFIKSRKLNWEFLYNGLKPLEEFFILPKKMVNSDPSWFGFVLTVRPDAPFSRNEIIEYLEERKIATRLLFMGNVVKQPAYKNADYRIVGNLENTDTIMNRTFWIGSYPGLSSEMLSYVVDAFNNFCSRF